MIKTETSFTKEMMKAIKSGIKTQTRRPIKPQPQYSKKLG